MSAMEQSLRRALEAGDARDPAYRESIYSASERALERMLAAKALDPEAAQAQRIRLAETINRVEDDYFAAGDADIPEAEAPEVAREEDFDASTPAADDVPEGFSDDAESFFESRAEPADEVGPRRSPDHGGPGHLPPPAAVARDRPTTVRSPGLALPFGRPGEAGGRPGPFLFGAVVLLVALIGGALFFYNTIFGDMETVGVGPAAPSVAEAGRGGESPAAAADWISLFDGTQLEAISTPTGGEVSAVVGDGDRPAVRLAAAGDKGEVDVSIGPGVVNTIKGRTVRVEITAGSGDGEPREFGVRCLFGGDTVCGRQRFMTLQSNEAFVFDMTVPTNPSASGTIAIDPSFGPAAKNIDLYSVRLRTLEGA